MTDTQYVDIPQPDDIERKERDDAMGSYLMMFASTGVGLPLPIINLIASVIYYFVNKGKSRFVHFHALQSLLSQAPTTLLNAGLVFWTFRNIRNDFDFTDVFLGYLGMVILANLIYFIFSIIACVQAYKGRMYYMLFFGRVAYHVAFSANNQTAAKPDHINKPPSF